MPGVAGPWLAVATAVAIGWAVLGGLAWLATRIPVPPFVRFALLAYLAVSGAIGTAVTISLPTGPVGSEAPGAINVLAALVVFFLSAVLWPFIGPAVLSGHF